ncbi:hypothetical protein THAOC_21592 [Thalassiosira oceanica]|uniref:Secreted protein n=1 Tax=Thalassiosira oceanica TaxID=159749 RepID=K0RX07_THAOC|nr:hypothetical protein THAOC_21592 [Thalassiosira oceanica]|eukprot:EJK58298.1 hypothetical protein THAOC_21592 [Thalassiosira oceanica]
MVYGFGAMDALLALYTCSHASVCFFAIPRGSGKTPGSQRTPQLPSQHHDFHLQPNCTVLARILSPTREAN